MKYLNDIYNVDCYKAIKEIPDKSIDLIYTDIPYDITYNGGGCFKTKTSIIKQKEKMQKVDNLINGIDYAILDEFVRVMKYIYIYIYGAQNHKHWI